MSPASIVCFRNCDWAVLPGVHEGILLLRLLTGTSDEVVAVHRQLSNLLGYTLPPERTSPCRFPPSLDGVAEAQSLHLPWQAARLLLREGMAPFRPLGRIPIRFSNPLAAPPHGSTPSGPRALAHRRRRGDGQDYQGCPNCAQAVGARGSPTVCSPSAHRIACEMNPLVEGA